MAALTEPMGDAQLHGKQDGNPQKASPTLSLADAVKQLRGTRSELATKIDSIVIYLNLQQIDLRNVAKRVTTTEGNVGELQQEVAMLKQAVITLQKLSEQLEERVKDSQGCSRSNNLPFVGFPEKAAGRSIKAFLKEWLMSVQMSSPLKGLIGLWPLCRDRELGQVQ
ncbi:hypothetical protein NDU88_005524 [Pleurodeles waltl]|uniref:Uncharacterized protein n=1 Tax=Pleurodeles waltl TaxID=8319 RepID=A0AAV7WAX1_PLEWA|nr:hypothetical protein NDU88_005524 [Pleurodeles waltl]